MPSPRVKLFQDGADLDSMIAARRRGLVSGYTTNPTLMRKAGISDYKQFAQKVIAAIPDMPISFEVFSDDFATMEREAREIASWGRRYLHQDSDHQHRGANPRLVSSPCYRRKVSRSISQRF